MLRTTNPEAAGEGDHDRRRPYQGQSVIFHGNDRRAGRTDAIADVMFVHDDDHVDLLIKYDADDFMRREKIPRKTDQNNINCWSFNDYDEQHYVVDPAATVLIGGAMQVEINELTKKVEQLEAVISKIDKRTAKK
jgi:hypothetical protein